MNKYMLFSRKKILLYFFSLALLLEGMDSFVFFNIPLPVFGSILICVTFFFYSIKIKKNNYYFILFYFLIFMNIIFTVLNYDLFHHKYLSTINKSYLIFLFLRYLNIISFLAIIFLVIHLCKSGYKIKIYNTLINLAVIICCYSIFLFFITYFNINFFDIITRNRLATDGISQQPTIFYGNTIRATGSFREPSFLGLWLILPLFLSFELKKKKSILIIFFTLIFTYSLSVLFSILISFLILIFLIIFINIKKFNFKFFFYIHSRYLNFKIINIFYFCLFFLGIYFFFNQDDIFYNRILSLAEDGLKDSNRGGLFQQVLNYFEFQNFGKGLGNLFVQISYDNNSNILVSILNLYFYLYYSCGLLIFVIIIFFLIKPILKFILIYKNNQRFLFIVYFSYLVFFFFSKEEFSLMFGVTYALFYFNNIKIYKNK